MKKQGRVSGSLSRGTSPGKQVVCRSQLGKGYPSPPVPPLTCFVPQPTFLVCLCALGAGHVRNMCLIHFLQEPQIFLRPSPTSAEHTSSHTLRQALLLAVGVLWSQCLWHLPVSWAALLWGPGLWAPGRAGWHQTSPQPLGSPYSGATSSRMPMGEMEKAGSLGTQHLRFEWWDVRASV